MKITVHVGPTGTDGYVLAYCPDLAGCSAAAQTEAEALELLGERIRNHFAGTVTPPAGTRRLEIEL